MAIIARTCRFMTKKDGGKPCLPCRGSFLEANLFGHPRLDDGVRTTTSEIDRREGVFFVTKSGSQYLVEDFASSYPRAVLAAATEHGGFDGTPNGALRLFDVLPPLSASHGSEPGTVEANIVPLPRNPPPDDLPLTSARPQPAAGAPFILDSQGEDIQLSPLDSEVPAANPARASPVDKPARSEPRRVRKPPPDLPAWGGSLPTTPPATGSSHPDIAALAAEDSPPAMPPAAKPLSHPRVTPTTRRDSTAKKGGGWFSWLNPGTWTWFSRDRKAKTPAKTKPRVGKAAAPKTVAPTRETNPDGTPKKRVLVVGRKDDYEKLKGTSGQ